MELNPDTLYETTPFITKMFFLKSEPQNIEYRMTNDEVWNRCALPII